MFQACTKYNVVEIILKINKRRNNNIKEIATPNAEASGLNVKGIKNIPANQPKRNAVK